MSAGVEVWSAEEVGPSGDVEDHDGVYLLFAGADAREQAERLRAMAAERGITVVIGPEKTCADADAALSLLWGRSRP
jgi:hypothetical protein